ncbi:histidinol dehydrogenase [Algicola sagamiensis]|uniref:histidinol dehydrogenase n=1 Tax=Algicola sagamiensis TaxID=163869 RepID=UPI0003696372|nr:histidinol dehydrogenase [Algicola sagamiensis]
MYIWEDLTPAEQQLALARPAIAEQTSLSRDVAMILQRVRQGGNAVLRYFNEKYDGVSTPSLRVESSQLQAAAELLTEQQKQAIDTAYSTIYAFHAAQKPENIQVETTQGVQCELRYRPLETVGFYIPGGSAPLPSTVLMLGVPAQIAGCLQKVLCTPPSQGEQVIEPAIAYAALKCEINEVFLTGGAQAIAAMAYGTEENGTVTIPKCQKIYGPGNRYVTEAKRQITNDPKGAQIDMPAGPSEVLVIGDESANAAFIAADLLSQAEHGPDSQVILLSDSQALIQEVKVELSRQNQQLSRNEITSQALQHARLILVKDMTEAVSLCNQYAPEHLIIQTQNASEIADQITNAASIFVGPWTPESAGDYASGTNHVLPTYGYSNAYSSLSLIDFYKRYTLQTLSESGLNALGATIETLADLEGLDAHKNAVSIRLAASSMARR